LVIFAVHANSTPFALSKTKLATSMQSVSENSDTQKFSFQAYASHGKSRL
jgi:hypothetical protein